MRSWIVQSLGTEVFITEPARALPLNFTCLLSLVWASKQECAYPWGVKAGITINAEFLNHSLIFQLAHRNDRVLGEPLKSKDVYFSKRLT